MLWTGPGWAQQPKPGGTLRIALRGDLTFFNANQGPGAGALHLLDRNNIFNSLLTVTPPPEFEDRARTGQVMGGPGQWPDVCLPSRRKA